MEKLRMKNWYWGAYVTKPLKHTSRADYELYIEEDHGWHHSEEFKSGYRLTPFQEGNHDLPSL